MRLNKLMKKSTFWLFTFFLLMSIVIKSCEKPENNLDPDKLSGIWYLDKFIEKESRDTLKAPLIKISFQGDNCVTVFAPCNHGQGQFSIDGHNVTVSELKMTERTSCSSTEENICVWNLSGSYLINEDTLRIIGDYGTGMILHKSIITDPYQCDLTNLLIDTIDSNRYYSDDIFNTKYDTIYGKWFVFAKYGGWDDGEYIPDFDFFELKRNGIYGYVKDFISLEYGKIQIEKLTDDELILFFIPDINSNTIGVRDIRFRTPRFTRLIGVDTLVLQDLCFECYYYLLHRVK